MISREAFSVGMHTAMAVAKDPTSLVLSTPSVEINFEIDALPAPTLIKPAEKDVFNQNKPVIIGLTAKNTFIRVFIDGIYNGMTDIVSHESGTANFSYRPTTDLTPGRHEIQAIAENKFSNQSNKSEIREFFIELPMPAPTLLKPIDNSEISVSQPFIIGLAKNNSNVKIFIDEKLDREFKVKNHDSGTANFAYLLSKPLTKGQHSVYTTAIDDRGKESQQSNIVHFVIKQPNIAQAVQEDRQGAVSVIEEKSDKIGKPIVISEKNGEVEKAKVEIVEEVEKVKVEIVGSETSQSGTSGYEADLDKTGERDGGIVNENEIKQSKFRIDSAIFLLFFLGILGWLFWVNRELVKEKREQNQRTDLPTKETDKNIKQDENKLL